MLLSAVLLGTGQDTTTTLGGAGRHLLEHLLGGRGNARDMLAVNTALGGRLAGSRAAGDGAGGLAGNCAGHFLYLYCFVIQF